jgi:hypothetical protein
MNTIGKGKRRKGKKLTKSSKDGNINIKKINVLRNKNSKMSKDGRKTQRAGSKKSNKPKIKFKNSTKNGPIYGNSRNSLEKSKTNLVNIKDSNFYEKELENWDEQISTAGSKVNKNSTYKKKL